MRSRTPKKANNQAEEAVQRSPNHLLLSNGKHPRFMQTTENFERSISQDKQGNYVTFDPTGGDRNNDTAIGRSSHDCDRERSKSTYSDRCKEARDLSRSSQLRNSARAGNVKIVDKRAMDSEQRNNKKTLQSPEE